MHTMKTISAYFTPILCALTVLLTAPFSLAYAETSTAGYQEPEPHLMFKKTVVVKEYKDGQAHTEQHIIKKGDHLWKILREQFKMSDASINFFCKVARVVNPEIEDLNVLQPSQNILLPFKYIPGDGSDNSTIMIKTQDYHHVVKPKEHLGQILRMQFNLPDTIIFNRITKSLIREANPDIDDLNQISPGETITVPREVFAMQQFVDHDLLPERSLTKTKPLQPEPVSVAVEPPVNPVPEPAAVEAAPVEMSFTEEPLND